MWRALETEPRSLLNGHEEGNLGHKPRSTPKGYRASARPYRDFATAKRVAVARTSQIAVFWPTSGLATMREKTPQFLRLRRRAAKWQSQRGAGCGPTPDK